MSRRQHLMDSSSRLRCLYGAPVAQLVFLDVPPFRRLISLGVDCGGSAALTEGLPKTALARFSSALLRDRRWASRASVLAVCVEHQPCARRGAHRSIGPALHERGTACVRPFLIRTLQTIPYNTMKFSTLSTTSQKILNTITLQDVCQRVITRAEGWPKKQY